MKPLYYILTLIIAVSSAHPLAAQEENNPQRRTPQASRGARAETQQNTGLPDLTVRAQDLNERNIQEIGNAPWMRILYREIDLTKDENAPLYYPTRPMNGQMNLFTIIFQLLSEGKLKVYKYIDGYEIFDEEHEDDFKEILNVARIYYEEVPGRPGEQPSLIINENDIPSAEVESYYVKEAWYFDQNNSVFDVKTLAICPRLSILDDFGAPQTTALFWVPYESIRPYINTRYIMTSNINNAKTFTIDDYFRRRMFSGEIIKTENLMNRTMRQLYPEADSLKLAQQTIETQLKTFEESLWFKEDTTQVAADTKEAKKETKTTRSARGRISSTKEKSSAAPKAAKAPKAQKSAPVRSVRRSR